MPVRILRSGDEETLPTPQQDEVGHTGYYTREK